MKTMVGAVESNVRRVKIWHGNRKDGVIHPDEMGYLEAKDLITVAKRPKSPLRRFFEQQVLAPALGPLAKLLHIFHLRDIASKRPGHEFSSSIIGEDKYVDLIASITIFLTAVVMLIVPLWVLATLNTLTSKLGVITAFTLALLLVLSGGTLAKPFEILATAAGYEDPKTQDFISEIADAKV